MLLGLFQHQVPLRVEVSDMEILQHLENHLFLPGWQWASVKNELASFALDQEDGLWMAYENQTLRLRSPDAHEVCQYLAGRIYHWIAAHSSDLFVHAGVVCWEGRALLFPGKSLAGKSTLVKAMVERGAVYFSDEFAVLKEGSELIHPFPRCLRLRRTVDEDGLSEGSRLAAPERRAGLSPPPAALGAVVSLAYAPDCRALELRSLSRGEMALSLFQHTVAAQRFAGSGLQWLVRACQHGRGGSGRRGEAAEAAEDLEKWLRAQGCW